MKKLFLLIILTLGIVLAEPVVGNAYVISALGIKNSSDNVAYVSGDTSVSGNANYVLAPQVIIYQEGLNYVGSYTPFTGCLNSQHYSNGEPSGFCFTGGLATTEQDGLMSKEDKTKLDYAYSKINVINYLNTSHWDVPEKNEATWVKNSDGSFTMTGTITNDGFKNRTVAVLYTGENIFKGMRLFGNPYKGDENCRLIIDYMESDGNWIKTVYDKDVEGDIIIEDYPNVCIHLGVYEGFSKTEVTFKPMITTDLQIGLNDFVSFDDSLITGSNLSHCTETFEIRKNAAYHNSIVRGKDITSYYKDGSLWDRIAGTNGFEPFEDLYLGDYFKMSRPITAPGSTETGSRYVTIAAFDWYRNQGNIGNMINSINYNHIVCVPGAFEGGIFHFGTSRMNPSDTTSGAYLGSEMHTTTIGLVTNSGSIAANATINEQLYAEFNSHLKISKEVSANDMNPNSINKWGESTGASSNFKWHEAQAILLSEAETYGVTVWSSSGFDTGSGFEQLPLFELDKNTIKSGKTHIWLKDVATSENFAVANAGGVADCGLASKFYGVRPRFILA